MSIRFQFNYFKSCVTAPRTLRRRTFAWQILVLLGLCTASFGHGYENLSFTQMEIKPHYAFLDVRITGKGSHLRDIIHANTRTTSPSSPLTPDAWRRAERYIHKHLIFTQKGVRLNGQIESVRFRVPDARDVTQTHFEMHLRYRRDPALATAPLQVESTLFDYLPVPNLIITLGNETRSLISFKSSQNSRHSLASFAPELTIVTPAQNALRYGFSGITEFLRGPQHATFLLVLLLACGGLAWRPRLAVLMSFTVAYGLAFVLATLRIVTVPFPWIAVAVALSLIYIGIESLLTIRGKRQQDTPPHSLRLLGGAALCGAIHGLSTASRVSNLSLPEEGAGLCLAAFLLGTVIVVTSLCALIIPAFHFWQKRVEHNAPGKATEDPVEKIDWPRILGRTLRIGMGVACYLLLGLVASRTLANAVRSGESPNPGLSWDQVVKGVTTHDAPTVPISTLRTSMAQASPGKPPLHRHTVQDLTEARTHFTHTEFVSTPRVPVAGQPVQWILKVRYREDQEMVNDFKVLHAKLLHLIIVSRDLSWYTHIHPVYQGNGVFTISTVFPRAGHYRFYADYMPEGQSDHEVMLHGFKVEGSNPLPSVPNPIPDRLRGIWLTRRVVAAPEGQPDAVGGPTYEVALMPMPSTIYAYEPVMLHYEVRDANGKPLTDLEPYMGAMGHCVILNAQPKTYLHVHPMEGDMENMDMEMTLDAMLTMSPEPEKLLPATFRGGPTVMFHTFFPQAGLYKVWAQFRRQGKVITAPFVLKVQPPRQKEPE